MNIIIIIIMLTIHDCVHYTYFRYFVSSKKTRKELRKKNVNPYFVLYTSYMCACLKRFKLRAGNSQSSSFRNIFPVSFSTFFSLLYTYINIIQKSQFKHEHYPIDTQLLKLERMTKSCLCVFLLLLVLFCLIILFVAVHHSHSILRHFRCSSLIHWCSQYVGHIERSDGCVCDHDTRPRRMQTGFSSKT